MDIEAIKKRLFERRQYESANVCLGTKGYYRLSKAGKVMPLYNYDYAWQKMHFIYSWLKENEAKRLPPFMWGHSDFYATLRGFRFLKTLEGLVQYECSLKGISCMALHSALVGLEGREVFMIKNGYEAWGIVTVIGSYFKYYALIKEGYARGVSAMPWDVIELR